jgi:hypothetical protein
MTGEDELRQMARLVKVGIAEAAMQGNNHVGAARDTSNAPSARESRNAVEAISSVAKSIGETLVGQVRTHPAIALGVATAFGFVLGGGLSTRVGRLAVLALLEYTVARSKPSRSERAQYVDG